MPPKDNNLTAEEQAQFDAMRAADQPEVLRSKLTYCGAIAGRCALKMYF